MFARFFPLLVIFLISVFSRRSIAAHPLLSRTLFPDLRRHVPDNWHEPPKTLFEELRVHFAKMSGSRIVNLEEKLAKAKEFVHRKEYGHRTFSHDNEADKVRPVSISPAQPNVSALMAPVLFEGDIFLSERQIEAILTRLKKVQNNRQKDVQAFPRPPSSKRSISADPDTFWQRMPIKFHLHDSLDLMAIQQIANALAYWENNTCVTFEHLDREPSAAGEEEDFVDFFKGGGCYSMIGRYGGRQGVSIGSGCERLGIVEHEIGHVLGLWHEQSRPDAWKYVQVEKEFVLPSYMADFQLRDDDEILTLGLPYDYGSVMHYGPTAFSSDGTSQTLIAKNMLFQSTIGQRDRLAFYDVMAVNKAYCADKCGGIPQLQSVGASSDSHQHSSSQAHCLNDGYPNPSRCSECICPSGYGGSKCERAQKSQNAICGGDLSLELDTWEQLESPGYSKDGYEVGQQCNWVVRSPQGTRVMAEFINDFSMFCGNICLDYVELKLATDQRLTGARFCCDQRFAGQLISEHNQMAILFRAQLSQDIGFQIRVRATRLPASIQRMGGLNGLNTGDRTTEEAPTPLGLKTFLPGKDIWGEWGPWSDCSRPCGGCGIRSRTRTCLSEVCLSGKSYESSACNFLACPIRPNCRKILFLSRLCHQSDAGATNQNCSQMAQQLAQCTQPSCCPPFYALNGKCVQTQFEEGQKETEKSNQN